MRMQLYYFMYTIATTNNSFTLTVLHIQMAFLMNEYLTSETARDALLAATPQLKLLNRVSKTWNVSHGNILGPTDGVYTVHWRVNKLVPGVPLYGIVLYCVATGRCERRRGSGASGGGTSRADC
ncbi:uncharacterized protein LOC128202481 [Galleria mellonella]|uniref:Uncharacterized protein LOC128202481 n=1 Tax=Galleria mellonella TaxID=7137 RepID=A0ABM3N5W5_GALME|nr:uncharacterized protein LOC128202481 [Galleria mellonella]